jgi:hypothetical protein
MYFLFAVTGLVLTHFKNVNFNRIYFKLIYAATVYLVGNEEVSTGTPRFIFLQSVTTVFETDRYYPYPSIEPKIFEIIFFSQIILF